MTHYIQHAKLIYAFQKVLTYLKIFIIVKKFNKLKKIEHVKFAKRKIQELTLIQKGTRLKEKAQQHAVQIVIDKQSNYERFYYKKVYIFYF